MHYISISVILYYPSKLYDLDIIFLFIDYILLQSLDFCWFLILSCTGIMHGFTSRFEYNIGAGICECVDDMICVQSKTSTGVVRPMGLSGLVLESSSPLDDWYLFK